MNCLTARQKLSAYVDENVRASEAAELRRHLEACAECHKEYEYLARLSSPLRELPRVSPPPDLSVAIALSRAAQWRYRLWERWEVRLANLMRPVALPAAGGLLAALLLFGALIPGVAVARFAGSDVPTVLQTGPRAKIASIGPEFPVDEDLLIEALVDQQGRIVSFDVLSNGHRSAALELALHQQLSQMLLTTSFEPATEFGQPIAGKVLLSIRRVSSITIRG